ncbi:hypothetical protein C0583_05990 [Candidatus Parcubacteria bacterium]|nr:MAG: hypothetical protein C0583_05990 [Candidatus Parcubacteria bacterium]
MAKKYTTKRARDVINENLGYVEHKCIAIIPRWQASELKLEDLDIEKEDNSLVELYLKNEGELERIVNEVCDITVSCDIFNYELSPPYDKQFSLVFLVSVEYHNAGNQVYLKGSLMPKGSDSIKQYFSNMKDDITYKTMPAINVEYVDYGGLLEWRMYSFTDVFEKKDNLDIFGITQDEANKIYKIIKKYEEKIYLNQITEEDVEFLRQDLKYKKIFNCNKAIWELVEMCDGVLNNNALKTKKINKKNIENFTKRCTFDEREDCVIVFNDYKSLLYYELLYLSENEVRRCAECNRILPLFNPDGRRYSGEVCSEKIRPECKRKRNARKVNKHRKKNVT